MIRTTGRIQNISQRTVKHGLSLVEEFECPFIAYFFVYGKTFHRNILSYRSYELLKIRKSDCPIKAGIGGCGANSVKRYKTR